MKILICQESLRKRAECNNTQAGLPAVFFTPSFSIVRSKIEYLRQRFHRLFQRSFRIHPVMIKDIDILQAEPLQ